MFDLHSHILPGIDDGPATVEAALEMADVASRTGTVVMLATPHRKDVTEGSSVHHVRELLADLNRRIGERRADLEVVLGMENHLDTDLPDEVSRNRALSISGSRYILVEMPFFGRPDYVQGVLFTLQEQGRVPVLAHPERIEAFQTDPDLLAGFVERGMLSQITAGSLIGHFGDRVRRFHP